MSAATIRLFGLSEDPCKGYETQPGWIVVVCDDNPHGYHNRRIGIIKSPEERKFHDGYHEQTAIQFLEEIEITLIPSVTNVRRLRNIEEVE